ncbi:MAG: hypothetical protein JST66_04960 [Bacteroidetes bacterium]|nr:hypothetical protein [Bacteroidota bacterium]
MRALAAIGLLLAVGASAQRSPFNGLEVGAADSTGHFRILIGGHFHGESTNRSGFPAATLLAGLDTINALGAGLFLSTGDLFMDPVADRPRYDRAFFHRLRMPFFNVPGNHDVARGAEAPGLGPIAIGGAGTQVLLFDTEANGGSLGAADLDVLRALADAPTPGLRQLLILSHRPIWAEDDDRYGPRFRGNTRSLTGTNFTKDIRPLLQRIAMHMRIYWISGSMGGTAPSSIFFQPDAPGITYIQCALRDEPRDALLIADVSPDTVRWTGLSLTGQQLLPVEQYDAAWWSANQGGGEGFRWRLLPYLITTTVTHRAFWWGVAVTLVLGWIVRRLLRRFL